MRAVARVVRLSLLPRLSVALCAGVLLISGGVLALLSVIFNWHHTVQCSADGTAAASGLSAVVFAGASAAAAVYRVTLLVATPVAALLQLLSRRWRGLLVVLMLLAVGLAASTPLYGNAPALTAGEAQLCR